MPARATNKRLRRIARATLALTALLLVVPAGQAEDRSAPPTDRIYDNDPLCTRSSDACESSFGSSRRVRIPMELLFERQIWRHTPIFHLIGRGPTQESAILVAEFQVLSGRPSPLGDQRVRIRISSPAFPRSLDEGIVHIDHYEHSEAIRVARRDGADARIVTKQHLIAGDFELIVRRGRVVSHNWCRESGTWCTIRAVRGDVALQVSYDPRGAPGTEEMIGLTVDFVNRFIVDGTPIERGEVE